MSSTTMLVLSAIGTSSARIRAARSTAASRSPSTPEPAWTMSPSAPIDSHPSIVRARSVRDFSTNSGFGDAMFTR
jgi:hypothetical protein